MPADIEIPTHLNMRIDAKVRYLTELAARSRGLTLTEYIEGALNESFRDVFLFEQEEQFNASSLNERRERLAPPADSLAHYADALWSDNPGVRLALRYQTLDNLMADEEKIIWEYILSQDDLAPKGKLNQKAIAERWNEIKEAALNQAKPKAKKGGK